MARTKRDGIKARNNLLWETMFSEFNKEMKGKGGAEWRAAYRAMCDEYDLKREKYNDYRYRCDSGIRQGYQKYFNRRDRMKARAQIKKGLYDDILVKQSPRGQVNYSAF